MNGKLLPWILTTIVTIALSYVTYTQSKLDKVSDIQTAFHKEYVSRDEWSKNLTDFRAEYNKDYSNFCRRLDNIDNKLDRILFKVGK